MQKLNFEKELLELYIPDIDWIRYEIEKIKRIINYEISPFIGRINFFITEKNIKPTGQEYDRISYIFLILSQFKIYNFFLSIIS